MSIGRRKKFEPPFLPKREHKKNDPFGSNGISFF